MENARSGYAVFVRLDRGGREMWSGLARSVKVCAVLGVASAISLAGVGAPGALALGVPDVSSLPVAVDVPSVPVAPLIPSTPVSVDVSSAPTVGELLPAPVALDVLSVPVPVDIPSVPSAIDVPPVARIDVPPAVPVEVPPAVTPVEQTTLAPLVPITAQQSSDSAAAAGRSVRTGLPRGADSPGARCLAATSAGLQADRACGATPVKPSVITGSVGVERRTDSGFDMSDLLAGTGFRSLGLALLGLGSLAGGLIVLRAPRRRPAYVNAATEHSTAS
jgi:hypothetical protein